MNELNDLDLYDDDEPNEIKAPPDLETTLAALAANTGGAANATIYYGLSDLSTEDTARLAGVWQTLDAEYRARLLRQLIDISEANLELDYRSLAFLALGDEVADVRVAAIELLWEDESLELMNRLIDMARWDESTTTRAAAVGELGRFILMGELGDLPEAETIRVQDLAIDLLSDENEDLDVRRRALEAISNSSHDIVPEAIEEAYRSPESSMQASAIFAMGRSCDAQWNETVLEAIGSDDPAFRYEAARASGELEIIEAIPFLARLAQESDPDVQAAAIWSLGEIGGGYALKILAGLAEAAHEADDDEVLEAIEEAIGNASLPGKELELDFDD